MVDRSSSSWRASVARFSARSVRTSDSHAPGSLASTALAAGGPPLRTHGAATGTALAIERTGVRSWSRGSSGGARSRPRAPGIAADERPHAPDRGGHGRGGGARGSGPGAVLVLPAFGGLLPGSGLRRGTTVAVDGRPGVAGATSLALALAAGPSRAGSWVAAVGLGSLGLVAAAELGVALERLAVVADPGPERAGWASVVAALVDGFDLVLVAADGRLRPADARRLVARVRERGAVLVAVGGELPGERSPCGSTVTASRGRAWVRVGAPAGPAGDRRGGGPGRGGPRRRAELWLPGPDGRVAAVEPVAEPIPLRPRRSRRPDPPGPGVGRIRP